MLCNFILFTLNQLKLFSDCFVRRYKLGRHVSECRLHEVINDACVSARKAMMRREQKRRALAEQEQEK